jgi:hypothetical protein
MPYSNLEDLIRFPFTMGNTFSDTWATQFVSGGFDFYRTGVTTVTADAYGTMITPAGTFTNVLRVHFVQVYRDSANFGVPYFIDYDNDQYLWYKDGVHWPVATTFILTSTTATFANATYTTAGPVGIDQGSDLLASASLFPNPAAEQLTLDLNLTKDQNLDILIFNGIGQEVRNLASQKCNQGTNRIQLEVDDLPEGIYFAKVMVSGSTAVTKRFVVAR